MSTPISKSTDGVLESLSVSVLRDLFTYGTGEVILKLASFVTIPIFTRIFSPEEYGKWALIAAAVHIVTIAVTLGGESAYARSYFTLRSDQDRRLLTSTWIIFLSVWSIALILLLLPLHNLFSLWVLGARSNGILFFLALIALPLNAVNAACGQVIRNQFRSRLFVALNVIATFLAVGGSIVGVVVLKLGLVGLFGGALVGSLLILPVRLWSVRTMLQPVFSWTFLRDMFAFGVPLVPMSLAYWILAMSDRLILGKLASVADVGFYSVAATVVGIMTIFGSALGHAWGPHALEIHEKHPGTAPFFFGRALMYILAAFGMLCVGITVLAEEVLSLLVPQQYHIAALAVGPLALGAVASATCQVTALGISLSRRTEYFAYYSWTAAAANLILNVTLVPLLGIVGAGLATAISWGLLTLAYGFQSQRLVPVLYDVRRTVAVVGIIVAFTVLGSLLPQLPTMVSIPVKGMFLGVFCIALSMSGAVRWNELVSAIRTNRISLSQS